MTDLPPLTHALIIEVVRSEETPRRRFRFSHIVYPFWPLALPRVYRNVYLPERAPMDLVLAPSQIETWPIDRLRPYARNAKIAASMAKFGWTIPCMVADIGELIAGQP